MITEGHILSIVRRQLPEFQPLGRFRPIEGGNLNHLWRLRGEEQSLIIKWAPPHIAANPEVPLSPERIHFEAKALRIFGNGNILYPLASDAVRPPKLLHFEAEDDLLIMEDVGSLPTIADWIQNDENVSVGDRLGRFIGKLHKLTLNQPELQEQFDNRDIQQTRLNVQYNPAADYLRKTGLGDVDSNLVSKKTKALGQALLKPGRCLVMGDLWPPSVLAGGGTLRLIDWEFVHYGRPLQDVAHFGAHCWMQGHTASSKKHVGAFRQLWDRFWSAYQEAMGDNFASLYTETELERMAIHAGAEILVRAAGPFKAGYVYESFDGGHPAIQQAGQKARELILDANLSALRDL